MRCRLVMVLIQACVAVPLYSAPMGVADRHPLHIGPVDLHPHLDFSAAYDDNVLLQHDPRQGDFSFVTSPGIQLVLGQSEHHFLMLDYSASFERFVRLTSQDANNQFVKLNGSLEFHQLTVGINHVFQDVKGPNTTVGARVRSIDNVTNVGLEYRLSSKTSIGLGYDQYLHDFLVEGLYDSREYSPYVTLFYHITPKTDLFCRFAYGWVSADGSPSAEYQEVDIGLRGKLTQKITGTVRFGYQHRSFEDTYSDLHSFVAAVDLEAALTRRTSWKLGFSRFINPSPSSMGNTYEGTRVETKLTYRFPRQKIGLWLGALYEYDEYEHPVEGVDRVDHFCEAAAGVTYDTTKWLQLSAEYMFWNNDSRLTALNFHRNLVTVHARVHF